MDQALQLLELFHQVSGKLGKTFAPMFREQKLSHAEIIALFVMHKKQTSRVIELATIIGVPASTLTGILDRLESQGFLVRDPDPEDRRSFLIRATPKLKTYIHGLMAPLAERLKEVFQAMPQNRLARLITDLRFVVEQLDRNEPKIAEKKTP